MQTNDFEHLKPVAAVCLHARLQHSMETLQLVHVVWKHNLGLMHCACICEAPAIHSSWPSVQDMLEMCTGWQTETGKFHKRLACFFALASKSRTRSICLQQGCGAFARL